MYRRFRELEKTGKDWKREDEAGSPKGDVHAEGIARGTFSGGCHSSG
jgi:hypothetical protein